MSILQGANVTFDVNRWSGGKGKTKHFYTVSDIARYRDCSERTVLRAAKDGKVDLDDLLSVAQYVMKGK